MRDTGNNVALDLAKVASGQASAIASAIGLISGITPSCGGVALTDAQADAAFGELTKLPDGSLTVSNVPISDVAHSASLGAVASETMPGHNATSGESAPLIAIDQATIITDAGATSFACSGGASSVQVGSNACSLAFVSR